MHKPTPLELSLAHSARTGWTAPGQLDLERDELERTLRWKRLGLIRVCILYPSEQAAKRRKARTIALKFRDRYLNF
jgi:hypothetical protein